MYERSSFTGLLALHLEAEPHPRDDPFFRGRASEKSILSVRTPTTVPD